MSNNNESQRDTMNIIFRTLVNRKIIEDADLSSKIFTSFIFIGIFTNIFFNSFNIYDAKEGSYGQASISIWSYGIILISLFCIVFFKSILASNNEGQSNMTMITSNIPMLILVFYLFWLISINMKHFNNINSKKVPSNYSTYNTLTMFVLLFQVLFFIFTMIQTGSNSNVEQDFLQKVGFLNYVLIFLNFILIMVQQLILDNFSVDIL
jgi:hypothetical protein